MVGCDFVALWLSNGLVAWWLIMALWPCGLLLMGPVVGYDRVALRLAMVVWSLVGYGLVV